MCYIFYCPNRELWVLYLEKWEMTCDWDCESTQGQNIILLHCFWISLADQTIVNFISWLPSFLVYWQFLGMIPPPELNLINMYICWVDITLWLLLLCAETMSSLLWTVRFTKYFLNNDKNRFYTQDMLHKVLNWTRI